MLWLLLKVRAVAPRRSWMPAVALLLAMLPSGCLPSDSTGGDKSAGEEHVDYATSLNNLATLYSDQGEYVEAEPLRQRALAICEKAVGPEHPDVAVCLNNLAWLYATCPLPDLRDGAEALRRQPEPLVVRPPSKQQRGAQPTNQHGAGPGRIPQDESYTG